MSAYCKELTRQRSLGVARKHTMHAHFSLSVQTTTVNVVRHQLQALSATRSVELAVSGVSCVLSWHVLSEGQVHYQCGHTSLECVECREC